MQMKEQQAGPLNFHNIVREDKKYKLTRQITGVIHQDRIWEQWYDQSVFEKEIPKMNQKDFLFSCIGDEENRIIINYRNLKKFTVRQFREMILKYEKAFTAMKLQKGDVICTIGLSTPEMYAIKYSATSIGLILCNLNILDIDIIDDGKNRLFRQLENVSPKMIFTLDLFEEKIYQIVNDVTFEKAVKVSMPLEYSVPRFHPERIAISIKRLSVHLSEKRINNQISLNEFLSKGNQIDEKDIVEIYEEGLPCNISFTSGTTGINKAVLLSHDANNALAFQHMQGNYGWKKGNTQLALVPPFLAFWDAVIVHVVLCQGGVNIIELSLDYKKIPAYLVKYKPNIGVWSQYLWSSVLKLQESDLKKIRENLKYAIIGGERCEINAAKAFFDKTGIVQMTGFGASEINTTFSITHPNCNKIGTAGIPLPYNNVRIVDDAFKDVTYNVAGKLFITGPCLMNGYYHRDDLTKKAIYIDENGISWYNTGDYAVMDEDGCLTILDRYIEPVQLSSGEKVNILDIVEKIKEDCHIKNCKITHHDGELVLHLSINAIAGVSKEQAINSIINTIKTNIEENCWPKMVHIIKELPRTSVGKVDYNNLYILGDNLSKKYATVSEKLILIENYNL